MIQDQLDLQCYVSKYKVIKQDKSFVYKYGSYRDKLKCKVQEVVHSDEI